MALSSDKLRLPPPWITPMAGQPNRGVQPVIIVGRRRLLLYPAYVQDYLDRVTAADVAAGNTSGLEMGVTDAASSFLQDLVSIAYLGISNNVIGQAASVIKAMPIMAGARTLAGALVPVVGPAPTNVNFVNDDYSRKTGVKSNGIDKYLNANRNNNADPENSKHLSVYKTVASTLTFSSYIASQVTSPTASSTRVSDSAGFVIFSVNSGGPASSSIASSQIGFLGVSRQDSTNLTYRGNGTTSTVSNSSNIHINNSTFVFARSLGGSPNQLTDARLAVYSIGESLNLALLDARVTTLINAYSAAIA